MLLITSLCCILLTGNAADTLNTLQLPDASVEASSALLRAFVSSASPTTTLSGTEMQTLGIDQVSDALKLMNGVSVKDYGGLGGMKCVSVRNLGAQHTGVTYDGVPVSNCQAGQIDLARFCTQHLQEVRLDIGMQQQMDAPASTECYSGIIELTTGNPTSAPGGRMQLSYSNWNTLQAQGSANWQNGVGTALSYRHTDGNYPYQLHNGTLTSTEHRHNSRVDDGAAEVNYRHTLHALPAEVTAKLYGYGTNRQLPGSLILYNNVAREEMQEGNVLAQARYRQWLDAPYVVSLTAKYNHALTLYDDGKAQPSDPAQMQHQYHYWQNEYYASAGIVRRPMPGPLHLQAALFYDLQLNHLHSNLSTARSIDRTTHQEVLRLRSDMQRISLQASLLATQYRQRTSHQHWAPSVGTNILLLDHAHHQIRLRAMARQAYRLASFNEEFYYPLGQHDLRPERASECGAGINYQWSANSQQLTLALDAYHNRVHDKIIAFPTTFAWKMANLGKATTSGLEATLMLSKQMGRAQCNIGLNYQWQQSRNLDDPTNANTYRQTLPYTPRNSAGSTLTVQMPWCTVGYTVECVGERYASTMNTQHYRLAPYQCHNLTVSRAWKRLSVQGSVLNLSDEQYSIIQYYPMPGRQFRLSINYQFK